MVLLGSWQTGTGVRARAAELTRSHLMVTESSCARRQKETRAKAGWGSDRHAHGTETRKAEEAGAGHICAGDGVACPHSQKDGTRGFLAASQLLLALKFGHMPTPPPPHSPGSVSARKETRAHRPNGSCAVAQAGTRAKPWGHGLMRSSCCDLMRSSCCMNTWG